MRIPVEKPDYRNNGNYQFVTGWTGGGAEMCVHLTREEVKDRLTTKYGPGELIDDGTNLWWFCPEISPSKRKEIRNTLKELRKKSATAG